MAVNPEGTHCEAPVYWVAVMAYFPGINLAQAGRSGGPAGIVKPFVSPESLVVLVMLYPTSKSPVSTLEVWPALSKALMERVRVPDCVSEKSTVVMASFPEVVNNALGTTISVEAGVEMTSDARSPMPSISL